MSFQRQLKEFWWDLKYRFIPQYRYHIIKLSNPSYKRGWLDSDTRILYACFKILQDFVEKEKPFEHIDWNSDDYHAEAAWTWAYCYFWWTKERFEDADKEEALLNAIPETANRKELRTANPNLYVPYYDIKSPQWKEWCDFSVYLENKEDEVLQMLIKVRHVLWT